MSFRYTSFLVEMMQRPLNPLPVAFLFALYPALILVQRQSANAAAALLFLLALLSLWRYGRGERVERQVRWLIWSCIAYLLVALFNWALRGMSQADWLVLGRYARFILFIPFFYLFRRYPPREGALWWSCLLGALLGGLWAVFESSVFEPKHGEPAVRVTGATHNPIIFGDLSMALGLLTVCGLGYFAEQGRKAVALALLAFLFGLLGSFLSGSRGGWLVLPAAALLGWWFASRRIPWKYQTAIVAAIAAMFAALMVLPQTGVYERSEMIFTEALAYFAGERMNTSVGYRLEMWLVAAEIIVRHPFCGVGLDGYAAAVNEMVEQGMFDSAIAQFGSPHNQFLNVFVSSGIMGLATMLAVFIAPLSYFWGAARSRDGQMRRAGIGGLMLLLSFAVFGLTESIFERATPVMFFVLLLSYFTARIASLRSNA